MIFSHDPFRLGMEYDEFNWPDAIMYKVFYPLLERVRDTTLMVVNEFMRSKNRSDLTYNCMHHYLNQTPHRIVFEWFPVIDDPSDFMILMDMDHPNKFKGRGLDPSMLNGLDISGYDRRPVVRRTLIEVSPETREKYEKHRDDLFENLGSKDPDTVPRNLHVWCGKYKPLEPGVRYVARNKRLNKNGLDITTYKEGKEAEARIAIDIPHRRLELNDFLKTTQQKELIFIGTDLGVDTYYWNQLEEWNQKAGEIFALTGIQPG